MVLKSRDGVPLLSLNPSLERQLGVSHRTHMTLVGVNVHFLVYSVVFHVDNFVWTPPIGPSSLDSNNDIFVL